MKAKFLVFCAVLLIFLLTPSHPVISITQPNDIVVNTNPEESHESHGTDMSPLFFITLSLFIGVATRYSFRKSPLPYTVALIIMGVILALPLRLEIFNPENTFGKAIEWAGHIDPHLILYIFLPTLIFEAAFALDTHTFKRSFKNAAILAGPGLIVGMLVIGMIMIALPSFGLELPNWNFIYALLFGAIIMATDPVAVVALLKELGASKKLSTLIESESLLNDGTAIVFYMVLLGIATGVADGSLSSGFIEFLRVALGGSMVGLLIGWVIIYWLKHVFNDPLFEITVIIAAAYLTFFVAENFFHVSGVLGLVSLGLLMASVGKTRISPEVNHFLHEFWELAAFLANTLIFIIVGVVVTLRTEFSFSDLHLLLIVYIGIHIARAVMIVIFYPIMKKSGYGMSKNDAIVLWWGGLRGAVGLALALLLTTIPQIPFEVKTQILFLTAGIVILTSFINATTTKKLVFSLGMTKISGAKAAILIGISKTLRQSSENMLDKLKNDRYMKGADWDTVQEYIIDEITFSNNQVFQVDPIAEMRKKILHKEKASYWEQFEEGLLGRDAVTELSAAVTILMDEEGKIPLSARKDIEYLWKTPKILTFLQKIPLIKLFLKRSFVNRLANSYDCARGFVAAQDDVLKLLKSLSLNIDESAIKLTVEDFEMLEGEIYENRIQGLTFIRNLKDTFPEIYQSIETRQAIRTLLNHQRTMVQKYVEQRKMEPEEATRFIETIEEKMYRILNNPPKPKSNQISQKILNEIPWLQNLNETQKKKVIDQFTQEMFSIGEVIVKSKKNLSDLLIIQRGTAKMIVDGKTSDILGPGSVIGEISIIGNVANDAIIEAELPVTILRLSASTIQKLMQEIPPLTFNLWFTAAIRFAEEQVQFKPDYREMSQSELRSYLSKGEPLNAIPGQKVRKSGRLLLLLQGAIQDTQSEKTQKTPGIIDFEEFICINNAKIFVVP